MKISTYSKTQNKKELSSSFGHKSIEGLFLPLYADFLVNFPLIQFKIRRYFGTNVNGPNSIPYLDRTPVVKTYVIKCGFKSKYQKDMCSKEIGLHAQKLLIILDSIINIFGEPI